PAERKGRGNKYGSQGGGAAAAAAAEELCRAGSVASGSMEAGKRGAPSLQPLGYSQEGRWRRTFLGRHKAKRGG
nr:hypothetical protein [Tanacetum cinerariifolium]